MFLVEAERDLYDTDQAIRPGRPRPPAEGSPPARQVLPAITGREQA